jgi:hypothetical protein
MPFVNPPKLQAVYMKYLLTTVLALFVSASLSQADVYFPVKWRGPYLGKVSDANSGTYSSVARIDITGNGIDTKINSPKSRTLMTISYSSPDSHDAASLNWSQIDKPVYHAHAGSGHGSLKVGGNAFRYRFVVTPFDTPSDPYVITAVYKLHGTRLEGTLTTHRDGKTFVRHVTAKRHKYQSA